MKPEPPPYKRALSGSNRILTVPVWITPQHDSSSEPVGGDAMIDTGASISVIDQSVVDELGLQPLGRFHIWEMQKGRTWADVYEVLLRPVAATNAPIFVHAVSCDDLKRELKVTAIIGMDLIRELRITHANGLEHLGLVQPKYVNVGGQPRKPEPVAT